MTQKNITDQLRANFTADLAEFLAQKYDVDVCQTAAGTLMIPTVDAAGDDLFGASAFYSVEFDAAGEVLSVDSGRNDSIDGDELVAAAHEAAASGKETGRTGRFLFIVEKRGDGTFVAFIDSSVTDDSLTTLLRYELIVGGAALVLIFLLSLFLSSRIIKPLEENDRRQKQFVSDAGHELKTPISVISAIPFASNFALFSPRIV